MRCFAHISGDEYALLPNFFDAPGGFLCILMILSISDHYMGAFFCERDGHCTTNTAVSTGNDGNFVAQPQYVFLFLIYRLRLHPFFLTLFGAHLLRRPDLAFLLTLLHAV